MGGRIMNFSLTAWPCYRLKSLAWKDSAWVEHVYVTALSVAGYTHERIGPKRQPDRRCSLGGVLSSFERTGLGHLCSIWIGCLIYLPASCPIRTLMGALRLVRRDLNPEDALAFCQSGPTART